jgi:hypothetical protein
MTPIPLPNPITTLITSETPDNLGLFQALFDHFSRAESTMGVGLSNDDSTIYMWPKEYPMAWTYILTTSNAANATGFTGWLDFGKDASIDSPLPSNPATWVTANSSGAMTQHGQTVNHTKFLVHEYGDAVWISELNTTNTHFVRNYHAGNVYSPYIANATDFGTYGLGLMGGTGNISTSSAIHALLSSAGGTEQLASRFHLVNDVWCVAKAHFFQTSNVIQSIPAFDQRVSPICLDAKGANIVSTTNYFALGLTKYIGYTSIVRAPGLRFVDDDNEIAYVATYNSSASTLVHVRSQYGISSIVP